MCARPRARFCLLGWARAGALCAQALRNACTHLLQHGELEQQLAYEFDFIAEAAAMARTASSTHPHAHRLGHSPPSTSMRPHPSAPIYLVAGFWTPSTAVCACVGTHRRRPQPRP